MADIKKVLLIQWDQDETGNCYASLSQMGYSVRVLECNGYTAVEEAEAFRPDVVVLPPQVGEMPGEQLIKAIRAFRTFREPAFLVVSEDPQYRETFDRPYVSYFYPRPLLITGLVSEIQRIASEVERNWQNQRLSAPKLESVLTELGVPAHLKGYDQLCYCVRLYAQYAIPMHEVTTKLYLLAAKACKCKPEHIERNIRHAMKATWERGNQAAILRYFGNGRLTNSMVICKLAEYMQHWWDEQKDS